MENLIYVFNESDRDILSQNGFLFLYGGDGEKIFVFKNKEESSSLDELGLTQYVFSNILPFSLKACADNNTGGVSDE